MLDQTKNIMAEELSRRFEEVPPMEFYREIFPDGELDEYREHPEERKEHKYTGIILEFTDSIRESDGKRLVRKHIVTDDLDEIDSAINRNTFQILAPVSYVGKNRKSLNARDLYAMCIEIDNILIDKTGAPQGLKELLYQMEKTKTNPLPTYIVASGNGIHLYYIFEKPIRLYQKTNPNTIKTLMNYKKYLTRRLWNMNVTRSYKENEVQYESLFQGFRMVGTVTKNGGRVLAYRTGKPVSIDYMNSFVDRDTAKKHPETLINATYKSRLSLEEARKKYPDWYKERVVEKRDKKKWCVSSNVYEWWLRQIKSGATVGHRYYCMMCLVIYAIKCGNEDKKKNPNPITEDRLIQDCLELQKIFDDMKDDEKDSFSLDDMADALQAYDDQGLYTYPINSISNRSGIPIEKSKRNKRKQKAHLKIARFALELAREEEEWKSEAGRPSKKDIVQEWRTANPSGKKADCIRETGLSKPTVYKWWNE